MKEVKHIFFDLDHTIWDFEKNSSESLAELFFEFELNQKIESVDEFISAYQRINGEYWKQYGAGLIDKETIRFGRFDDTFKEFNFEDLELVKELGNKYVEVTPHKTHIFPYTHEVLTYLSKKYPLHIISNGFSEIIDIKMSKSNIQSYFKLILSSEEVGVHKPNPLVFQTALKRTGAVPNESVMIGDNFEADVMGAHNCGWKSIFFNPKKTKIDSEITEIHCLSELKNIF